MRYACLLFVIISCANPSPPSNEINEQDESLRDRMEARHLSAQDLHILIDKSDYTLQVKNKDEVLISYDVVFGPDPVNDKRMEGDKRTPEGRFKIRDMYPHRSWSKFIWIDYPNEVSWRKHEESKRTGEIPESARIGGEIGIHGVPERKDGLIDERVNWTLGCISLKNADINELYSCINRETWVEIVP